MATNDPAMDPRKLAYVLLSSSFKFFFKVNYVKLGLRLPMSSIRSLKMHIIFVYTNVEVSLYSPYTSLFVDNSDWHAERSHRHVLYFLCS